MKAFSSGWIDELQRVHGREAFAWCISLPLFRSPTVSLSVALTPHPEPLTVSGVTFYPWPCAMSDVEENGDARLPEFTLALANVGRMLMPYVLPADPKTGPIGRGAIFRVVRVADASVQWNFTFTVQGIEATREAVNFRLGVDNLFEAEFPLESYSAKLCQFPFGKPGEGCPYVVNAAAAYRSCPGTYAACSARGDDMRTRNLGDVLPEGWGGCPGLEA